MMPMHRVLSDKYLFCFPDNISDFLGDIRSEHSMPTLISNYIHFGCFIFTLMGNCCKCNMKFQQINPILKNSTSLSCTEFTCRSQVEATMRCLRTDGCCGAWAEEEAMGEVHCGICNCKKISQSVELTEHIASIILLRNYGKFAKGNYDALYYLYLTYYKAPSFVYI